MNKIALKSIAILMFSVVFVLMGYTTVDDLFKLPKSIKNEFSFVPMGKIFNGQDTVLTNAFYMSKYEVSNKQYNDFLVFLKKNRNEEAYKRAKIDTNNWDTEFKKAFFEPLLKRYHSHEAYNNYPVVNVSLEGATLYCKWLADKLNAESQHSSLKIEVRIPSRDEWLRAAVANNKNEMYSWGTSHLRNAKGQFMCNFKNIGAEHIAFIPGTNSYVVKLKNISYIDDNALITAQVNSYFPNGFKLYNMNGNVAEIVTDGFACGGSWNSTGYDVRNQSIIEFQQSSSTVGFRPILFLSKKE